MLPADCWRVLWGPASRPAFSTWATTPPESTLHTWMPNSLARSCALANIQCMCASMSARCSQRVGSYILRTDKGGGLSETSYILFMPTIIATHVPG